MGFLLKGWATPSGALFSFRLDRFFDLAFMTRTHRSHGFQFPIDAWPCEFVIEFREFVIESSDSQGEADMECFETSMAFVLPFSFWTF